MLRFAQADNLPLTGHLVTEGQTNPVQLFDLEPNINLIPKRGGVFIAAVDRHDGRNDAPRFKLAVVPTDGVFASTERPAKTTAK